MSDLQRISMSLEGELLERFDRQVVAGEGYPTRSEAIKALMRAHLVEREWTADEEVAGAVTLVYDHHRRGLADRVMHLQHHHVDVIVSTQHVHLDHDHCLEIVVVRGRAEHIRALTTALRSVKGLKHLELVMTTTGHEV